MATDAERKHEAGFRGRVVRLTTAGHQLYLDSGSAIRLDAPSTLLRLYSSGLVLASRQGQDQDPDTGAEYGPRNAAAERIVGGVVRGDVDLYCMDERTLAALTAPADHGAASVQPLLISVGTKALQAFRDYLTLHKLLGDLRAFMAADPRPPGPTDPHHPGQTTAVLQLFRESLLLRRRGGHVAAGSASTNADAAANAEADHEIDVFDRREHRKYFVLQSQRPASPVAERFRWRDRPDKCSVVMGRGLRDSRLLMATRITAAIASSRPAPARVGGHLRGSCHADASVCREAAMAAAADADADANAAAAMAAAVAATLAQMGITRPRVDPAPARFDSRELESSRSLRSPTRKGGGEEKAPGAGHPETDVGGHDGHDGPDGHDGQVGQEREAVEAVGATACEKKMRRLGRRRSSRR